MKRSGNGWEARCPAHKDSQASLSVDEGDDGRVLVKCHAGCQVADICYAMNVELKDLFQADTLMEAISQSREEAIYDYRDEGGDVLFQVVRYRNPKTFRQRRKDEQGEWVWSLKDLRRVPYRLPEVFEAISQGRSVWIC